MKAKTLKAGTAKILSKALLTAALCLPAAPCAYSLSFGYTANAPVTELKQFEGFYQFPNRVAYVQILEKDKHLVAKQVWDNREYVLVRKTDLSFETRDEEYQLEFVKGPGGTITGARIMNRIMLTKVNFDPNQVITLTADQLKKFEGRYQFERDENSFIEISAADKTLKLKQLWDGKIIHFSPRSEVDFFNEELSFPLRFVGEQNEIKQVICFSNDVWIKVK